MTHYFFQNASAERYTVAKMYVEVEIDADDDDVNLIFQKRVHDRPW